MKKNGKNKEGFAARLLEALTLASKINGRSCLPILEGILLEGDGKTVVVTKNMIGIAWTKSIPGNLKGRYVVKMKDLMKILPLFEDEVKFSKVEGFVEVSGGKRKFKMPSFEPDDYPVQAFEILNKGFEFPLNMRYAEPVIAEADKYASDDEARPYINGIWVTVVRSGKMLIEATDGHRLFRQTVFFNSVLPLGPDVKFQIPKKHVKAILQLLEGKLVAVHVEGQDVVIDVGGGERLYFKSTDAVQPPFDGVIPKANPTKITFGTEELAAALETMKAVEDNRYKTVKVEAVQVRAILSTRNIDTDVSAEETVDCQIDSIVTKEVTFGLNRQYFSDMLDSFDGSSSITLNVGEKNDKGDVLDGIVVEQKGRVVVVMPVRLD